MLNGRFLARGVALYRSLERVGEDFVLRVVCTDDVSRDALARLALPHVQITPIEELERFDPEFHAVKEDRNSWEYCWTAKSVACRYYFRVAEPELELLTYLDADIHFSSSPSPLFEELGDRSILLIPHRFVQEGWTERFGIYNAGTVAFRNDSTGMAALDWWRERCLEWCYEGGQELGRCGDQKYIEDWPERFGAVGSAQTAAGLALWNEDNRRLEFDGDQPLVDGQPLIFFHHSGLRASRAGLPARLLARATGWRNVVERPVSFVYAVPSPPRSAAVKEIWQRYALAVSEALGDISAAGSPVDEFVHRTSIGRAIVRRL